MKLIERRTQQIYNREQNHLITSPNWPERQQPHGKIKTVWGKIDGIRWCDRKNGFQLKHNCKKSNQVSLNMGAWSQDSIKKHANKLSKFTLLKVKLYFLQFSISSVSPHTVWWTLFICIYYLHCNETKLIEKQKSIPSREIIKWKILEFVAKQFYAIYTKIG